LLKLSEACAYGGFLSTAKGRIGGLQTGPAERKLLTLRRRLSLVQHLLSRRIFAPCRRQVLVRRPHGFGGVQCILGGHLKLRHLEA
jgi:hypothetical protein